MDDPAMSPEERFDTVIEALLGNVGVTLGSPGKKGFGSSALQVDGKIFAMLNGGRLVIKLPRQRVDVLVAGGDGERFDPRRNGRLMKEWLTVEPMSDISWPALAKEAYDFVACHPPATAGTIESS